MTRKDKLFNFLIKPPAWVCILIWTFCFITLSGSISLYFVGLGLKPWAIPVHVIALVFVILAVYAVLTVIGIPERAKDSPKIQTFFQNYSVRAFVYAACSILLNTCYVVFGIIIANIEHSPWLGALVGYHIFLILPRLQVFLTGKVGRGGKSDERRRVRAYAYCGIALMLLSVAIVPVIRLVMDDRNTYNYFIDSIIYVTAIATYSFVKLGIALHNLRKVRKSDDLALRAVKNVSFADALISIFALQAMMLKELNTSFSRLATILNPLLGSAICIAVFAIGVHMTVKGRKTLKALGDGEETAKDDGGESNE